MLRFGRSSGAFLLRSLRLRLLRLRLLRFLSRLDSSIFSASAFCLSVTVLEAPKKFLMRAIKDNAGAVVVFSSTIGAGAAGVIPFTAATGLTSFAVSSAFGI